MADALGIETRSRSRSKTPGLLFGENGDSKNAKKIPTISLIEEEDDVVEVIPSSQGSRPRRQRRSAKVVTSDTSTDVSTDSFKTTTASKSSVVTTTVTEVVKRSTNGSKEESSEQATSTTITKSTIEGPDAPESQSIFNNIFNAIKTSTPILTNKRSTRITQDVMSPSVNIAEHPAYKEYKEAGEYWNKYPKTDYTYSELSPHRRELKNGVVAMPNMSRRSLEKYQNRVEVMIQNNPAEESFLRRKFLTTSNMSFQKRSADLQYDSTDEVDVSELRRTLQNRQKPADNIVSRFFLMIISYFYSSYYSVTQFFRRVFYRTNSRYTYTPVRKQKGFFSRASEAIKKFVLLGFSKVYIFVSTILCLDTWILYSRSDNADKVARRRRFLLLLLILLPLLLLGAWLLSDDENKLFNITAPPTPDFTSVKQFFAKLSTPQLPTMNFTPSFNLNWLWTPLVGLGASFKGFMFSRSKEELKIALDDDKLQGLIAHIERYIDLALVGKFEENNKIVTKETNDKMTVIFATTLNDALANYHYQLTAHDIEIIAARIKTQIESDLTDKEQTIVSKFTLSNNEQLRKLQDQVKQNIDLKFTEIKLDNQNVNLDDVLLAILKSDKLAALIDGKIKPAFDQLNQHDIEINNLKLDLNSLKAEVISKFVQVDNEFTDVKRSLGEDFYKLKQQNDKRLDALLLDIDAKLASFGDSHFTSVDESVRKNLFTILGLSTAATGGAMDEEAIKNWIGSMFVAKSELEERLKHVETNSNEAFKLQLNENAGILMNEINEEIKRQVAISLAAKAGDLTVSGGGISEEEVLKIVKGVLAIYDADKTGLVDFALESAGGQVISTRCTESYRVKSAEISIFGIPLWYPSNTPRTVISPSVQPGDCWAFQGFPGYLVVQLNNLIHVTGFSYEHIPQSLAPNGLIDSAPNNFTVWGLLTEMDKDPVNLGRYFFSAEPNAPSLQYFPVQNKEIDQPYQIIELRVESNHGNPRYTCLYRFRVHGDVVKH